MKTIFVVLAVALCAASPARAQFRAAQAADLSALEGLLYHRYLPKSGQGIATPPSKPAGKGPCPMISLSGATIGRGLFGGDWSVREGAKTIGFVSPTGGDYRLFVAGAETAIRVARRPDGAIATVSDCAGKVLGTVEETDGHGTGHFRVKDAAGKVLASGDSQGTSFDVRGPGGWATVANDHWLLDRYKVTTEKLDSGLVAALTLLNDEELYRRGR